LKDGDGETVDEVRRKAASTETSGCETAKGYYKGFVELHIEQVRCSNARDFARIVKSIAARRAFAFR